MTTPAHVALTAVIKVFQQAGGGAETDALGPIDLDLRPGEFCVVVGPSGCGKSTLFDLIAGLSTTCPAPQPFISRSTPTPARSAAPWFPPSAFWKMPGRCCRICRRPWPRTACHRQISPAIPADATIAIDVGVMAQGVGGAFPYFKIFDAHTTIVPSSFYGMGFAFSALPAAKRARPDHPAVGLVGDGSFGLIMNVLPTAVEFKLPVTSCILNGRALGSIRDIQRQAYNGRYMATEFGFQPDFAAVARACGCHGENIEDPNGIDSALERAQQANAQGQPAVLNVSVAKERLEASTEFFKR